MDLLLKKYNDYLRLVGCTAIYELENGLIIEYTYKKENFVHLIGLHKLNDILLISMFNNKSNLKVNTKTVISNIKKGKHTDSVVKGSAFFSTIADRYNSFDYDNLATLNYTDAVIDFNASLIPSKLKSDYLLFEERPTGQYNHLGVAYDSVNGVRYAETFLHATTDMYIKNQTIVKVKKFKLIDAKGNVVVADSFKKRLEESYGYGIRRAKNAMKDNGSPELVFEPDNEVDDYTMVTAFINEEYQKIQCQELGLGGEKADKKPIENSEKPIKADKKPIKVEYREAQILDYVSQKLEDMPTCDLAYGY